MRATKKSQGYLFAVSFLGAVTLAGAGLACSSSSGSPDGGAGSGGHGGQAGGGAGAGGSVDGGADRTDATSGFMAFAPCASASDYVSNTTVVAFGGTLGFNYAPACLKAAPGATITFGGDFATHPLAPSVSRTTPGPNPIASTNSGTIKTFTFDAPGFYGYFCLEHGTDDGIAMAGMIWVQ
jgi:plastocyanin